MEGTGLSVADDIAARASLAHRWTLNKAREALRFGLYGRDRTLPQLAERRELKIRGAEGMLDARLYVPNGAPRKGPLLLFFHGGGFLLGDLDTHDALCTRVADASMVRVLSCRYRLAPEHRFPAQLDDAMAAAKWTVANAGKLGGDKRRLLIGGDSAGGYLAIAVAARMKRAFKGQVLIYPLMSLDDDIWAQSLGRNTRLIGRIAVRYIETQLATHAPSLLAEGALAPLPTVLVAGGPLDPCADDAVTLAKRLRALGAPVFHRTYEPLMHGFANLTHVLAGARRAVDDIGRMTRQLAASIG